MQITAIKKEKQHLTRVCFDDSSEVLLDNDICSQECLKAGTLLTDEALDKLIYRSQYVRAKSRAMWYLDRADVTENGLYKKLVRAGFDKKASAAVVARFVEVGLINDRRYAERYAERLISANTSKREAVRKMLAKGLGYDLVNEVLNETPADEAEQIQALIEKKYKTRLEAENGFEKVFSALIRKGFSYTQVRSALKKYKDLEFCED